jgi:uncharacterized membrane protein YbhN (UPF0104 family)
MHIPLTAVFLVWAGSKASIVHLPSSSTILLVVVVAVAGAVYLTGTALASAAPTPGGVGAVEAALIAGLTATGVPNEQAVRPCWSTGWPPSGCRCCRAGWRSAS